MLNRNLIAHAVLVAGLFFLVNSSGCTGKLSSIENQPNPNRDHDEGSDSRAPPGERFRRGEATGSSPPTVTVC